MASFSFQYEKTTGKIIFAGPTRGGSVAFVEQPSSPYAILDDNIDPTIFTGVFPSDTHYIDTVGDILTSRPASSTSIDKTAITADGVDEAIISSIPNPSTVVITDSLGPQTVTVTDGTLEISSLVADTITIEGSGGFPELDFNFTVTAT